LANHPFFKIHFSILFQEIDQGEYQKIMNTITKVLILAGFKIYEAFITSPSLYYPYNTSIQLCQGKWYIQATNDHKFQDAQIDIRNNRFTITVYNDSVIGTKILREGKIEYHNDLNLTLAFLRNRIFLIRIGDVLLPEKCAIKTRTPKLIQHAKINIEDR
jgi:hypothetical protein